MYVDYRKRNKYALRVIYVSFATSTLVEIVNYAIYALGIEREFERPNFLFDFLVYPVLIQLALILAVRFLVEKFKDKKPVATAYILILAWVIQLNTLVIVHCGIRVVYSMYVLPMALSMVYNIRKLTYITATLSISLYVIVFFVYLPSLPPDRYFHTYMDFVANLGILSGVGFVGYAIFEAHKELLAKTISFYEGFQSVKQHLLQVKQIKHEMKNNLLALQMLMKDKQYEKAEAYLNEITNNTEKITGVNYCENLLINAVVGDLLQAGESKDIAVDFAVSVPETLNISETDLYCLFSNIFGNAVESCERVTNTANRFIKLNVRVKAPYLYISAINSKQHDIISINGTDRILSTKEDAENHGFGLWTISQIVKKHDGMLDINHDEHTFSIAVAVKVVDCI